MNQLLNKILPVFVGLDTEKDEYLRQEAQKIMNNCLLHVFYLLTAVMMISLMTDAYTGHFSIGTLLLFLLQQAVSIYSLINFRTLKIDSDEVYSEEDYRNKSSALKLQSFNGAVMWGFFMTAWFLFIFPLIIKEEGTFDMKTLLGILSGTFLFGILMYFLGKYKITKAYKE